MCVSMRLKILSHICRTVHVTAKLYFQHKWQSSFRKYIFFFPYIWAASTFFTSATVKEEVGEQAGGERKGQKVFIEEMSWDTR